MNINITDISRRIAETDAKLYFAKEKLAKQSAQKK